MPQDVVRPDGSTWDLIIFEGYLPATLPATPILAIAPPSTSGLGEVAGKLTNPGIGTLGSDEPILRFVDLSTTHIAEAQKLALPAWARSVIPGPKGAPLLYAGIRAGLPTAVLAFEPRKSDLPLQVAFPILIANLTGELLGGSAAPTTAVKPSDPIQLTVPSGAIGLHVVRPDGTAIDLIPGAAGGTSVTYTQTDLLGVYTRDSDRGARGIRRPGGSAAGLASAERHGSPVAIRRRVRRSRRKRSQRAHPVRGGSLRSR